MTRYTVTGTVCGDHTNKCPRVKLNRLTVSSSNRRSSSSSNSRLKTCRTIESYMMSLPLASRGETARPRQKDNVHHKIKDEQHNTGHVQNIDNWMNSAEA
ncbi:hypothetical protein pdam_00005275, partial [Pocillopora damicornis]